MSSGVKYTYEEVRNIVESYGYRLISNEYKNMRTKINIIDKDGYKYSVTLNNLTSGKKPKLASVNNPYTIENIQTFINNNKSRTIILSKNYKDSNELLEFKCECGIEKYYTTLSKVLNREKIRCNKCNLKIRGVNHRISFDDVVKLFEIAGLIPMFDNYSSCYQKLFCKNKDGYLGLLSYAKLKAGNTFDIVSKHNPFSIRNIKYFLIKSNLKCSLESTEYKNANNQLILRCECGKTYNDFKNNSDFILKFKNEIYKNVG